MKKVLGILLCMTLLLSSALLFGLDDLHGMGGDRHQYLAVNPHILLRPNVAKQTISLKGHSHMLALLIKVENSVSIASVTQKLFVNMYLRAVLFVHKDRSGGKKCLILIDGNDLVVAIKRKLEIVKIFKGTAYLDG